jgi:hypothetical protein
MSVGGCISRTTVYRDDDPPPPRVVVHKHKFYYYPSCQAYRDCQTNRWYWYEAGVWKVSNTPPKTVVIVKEAPQLIMIDTDDPKYCHETIVKQYPPKVVVVAPRKTLPPQSHGLAKGHDKQNARADAEAIESFEAADQTQQPEVQIVNTQESDQPKFDDHGNGKNDEDRGQGKDKEKGKDKDDDKGKPEKKDDKSGKGKKDS